MAKVGTIENRPEWLQALIEGLRNNNTRRNYESALASLNDYYGRFKGTESELKLAQYVRHLEQRGLSPRSIRQRVSVLKRILDHAVKSGVRKSNPVSMEWCPRTHSNLKPRCPNHDELNRLDQVLKNQVGFLAARDIAIIAVLRLEGLRIHEAVNLKHEDIEKHGSKAWRVFINGKGGFATEINFWPQTIALIKQYLNYIPKGQQYGPLFIPEFKPGMPMDARSVRKRCNHYFEKAQWRKGLSPHSFRHALAVQLLENGMPLTEVQRKLRHRFLASTFHYYSDVPSLRNPATEKAMQSIVRMNID